MADPGNITVIPGSSRRRMPTRREAERSFRSRVAALLREIEFDDGDLCGRAPNSRCASCGQTRREGHLPDCVLAAILKECEG